jgi:voltage-gated potassium channel
MPDSQASNATDEQPSAEAPLEGGLSAEVDNWLAAPMWCVTLAWMICLAGGLQSLRGGTTGYPLGAVGTNLFWWGLLLLWPIYVLELGVHALMRSTNLRFNLLYVLCPPLRLGGRDHPTWSRIWLPGALWQSVDRRLVERVEKATSLPMVGFALLVLPLLVIDNPWRRLIDPPVWLKFVHDSTSSVIWLAFAVELIVMVSIARRKSQYLARHWIDLAIVLLPMVEVLPALRLAAVARLGRVSRVSYLAKLSKVYRTRGAGARAFRALLLLDSVQRLLRLNPEKRLAALREKLEDYHYEMERIRCEVRELEGRIAADRKLDAIPNQAAGSECNVVGGD